MRSSQVRSNDTMLVSYLLDHAIMSAYSRKPYTLYISGIYLQIIFLKLFSLFNTCFICRPSDSTVSEDAGIEPRTVATWALTARRSNHSARSQRQIKLAVYGSTCIAPIDSNIGENKNDFVNLSLDRRNHAVEDHEA
jgi:hypothetical protein